MRNSLTKIFWNIEVWAVQKHVNLVDLVKSFRTDIFLQDLASIQKRTSPLKFAHLAEKSENHSVSNLSTKAAHALHMKTPTMKAWGAFQYGDRKPIVKKRVTKLVNVDVGEKTTAPPASSIAAVGMIEVSAARALG